MSTNENIKKPMGDFHASIGVSPRQPKIDFFSIFTNFFLQPNKKTDQIHIKKTFLW